MCSPAVSCYSRHCWRQNFCGHGLIRHCFHVDRFSAVRKVLSWSVASVDVVVGDLVLQSILNTPGTRKAFLWCENVHVASSAPAVQRTCCKSCIREDGVCLSLEGGSLSWQIRSVRWWKLWQHCEQLHSERQGQPTILPRQRTNVRLTISTIV
jgi:hypothetical protein